MPRALKFRFSLMMFLQYVVPGAIIPILSLYLQDATHLNFTAAQAGIIMAMPALAAIIAPFMTSHIADRFISADRMLALCHLLGAGVMLALSFQTQFQAFLGLYFVYGLLFTPTFGLTNTVALHHVTDAKRDFGGIRMWGTVGWVVIAWTFGLLWLHEGHPERLRHALIVSAVASFALGMYALTLPHVRVHEAKPKSLAYWKALKVFARPGLALLCVFTFVNGMTHQFYYFGMSPFLKQVGFAKHHIMPTMSLGQVSEVIVLGLLGMCLARLGTKRILVLGALAQVVRHVAFSFGERSAALIFLGIVVHGFCYAFWFTVAYLYVDHHSTVKTRAGAQQLFTIIITGLGAGGGYLLAGHVGQWCTPAGSKAIYFPHFWLVPFALALTTTLVMALFFKEEPPRPIEDGCVDSRGSPAYHGPRAMEGEEWDVS